MRPFPTKLITAKEATLFVAEKIRSIVVVFALVLLGLCSAGHAQTSKVIYSLTGPDGEAPIGSPVLDASGNLYATASQGGNTKHCGGTGCGTVFKLSKTAAGGWNKTVLHQFGMFKGDGGIPASALVLDRAGNLYGSTEYGGTGGNGTVYELSPSSTGGWSYSVIYNFPNDRSGGELPVDLALDPAGNLYGMTYEGGSIVNTRCTIGCGVVFKLSQNAGVWTETVLHNFTGSTDGGYSFGGLTLDSAGNLYGASPTGGDLNSTYLFGAGVVFKLSPNSSGGWTYNILHAFQGTDGSGPLANPVLDASGNLYGTAEAGGNVNGCVDYLGCGVVYKLAPNGTGTWTETVLHIFQPGTGGYGNGGGASPFSGVTLDASGNLYGTTPSGGLSPYYFGVAYKLSPTSTGGWTETVLRSFATGTTGEYPWGGVTLDPAGNVFGMAKYGGVLDDCQNYGCGVVYEITP
jgi:uncharacterized repeat protein (TIGR03803 family)